MMDNSSQVLTTKSDDNKPRPIKRRARMALSCQRCRKHRSRCSRSKPSCEQCINAQVNCVYLEVPGDLESTALRDRFSGLENQIHSLVNEFSLLEKMITNNNNNNNSLQINNSICTKSLSNWSIHQLGSTGLSIDTHMFHVTDIYSTLIQFAKDNAITTPPTPPATTAALYPQQQQEIKKPIWLVRNNSLFRNVRLSAFTSLRPNDGEDEDNNDTLLLTTEPATLLQNHVLVEEVDEDDDDEDDEIIDIPEPLPPLLVEKLLDLYKHCLLYGAVQPFDTLFKNVLSDQHHLSPAFQLLYASIICHMLPHAFYWHREIFDNSMDAFQCEKLSLQYYKWAKRLLSSIYFDTPSLTTCHAICNLVLYHIENGNTSVVYIYSGMAVRMALSLQLYREDALDAIAQLQASIFPPLYKPSVSTVKQYARSLLWFMYFLDTASSHYHNKPYEIHLDDHVSTTTFFLTKNSSQQENLNEDQSFFQWIEFHTCQITRDIRRTIFTHPEELQTSYEHIERIEKRLLDFQKQLPDVNNANVMGMNIWQRRCLFKQWIRHHGHWILIHQSYLPTPMSVQRCTTAAFALVELFDHWAISMDCYIRPCAHELNQACEILLYHVDQNTPIKQKAVKGLARLITVLLKTPVGDIARSRAFVQRVLKAIRENNHNNLFG